MKPRRLGAALCALTVIGAVAQAASPAAQGSAPALRLSDQQIEQFLLTAKVVSWREINQGINNTRRLTLSDGAITHDAQLQTVDVSKQVFQPARGPAQLNFRDTYRYNIAAYRFARLLKLTNVPVSVERRIDGRIGSITWWVEDAVMDEGQRRKKQPPEWSVPRTNEQIYLLRVFDALIGNTDRNLGNLLWSRDGTMWMIDHTRAFRLNDKVPTPATLIRCERALLSEMRSLTAESIGAAVESELSGVEISALLKRRDEIVAHFEARITKQGEAAVLYSMKH